MAEMQLWCVVVGDGSVFYVEIMPSAYVADLQETIVKKQRYDFAASQLKLYLAKEGTTWLSAAHADVKALRRGEVTASVANRLNEELQMDETATIQESISEAGLSEDLLTRRIHVLVQLPTESQDQAAAARQTISADVATKNKEDQWVKRLKASHVLVDEAAGYAIPTGTLLNGIDPRRPHLKREALLQEVFETISWKNNRFVLFSSPPASGKTSLLKLFATYYKDLRCVYVSCLHLKGLSCFEVIEDLARRARSEPIDIIIMDDAQVVYDQSDFWTVLIKNTSLMVPDGVKFIISATFSLTGPASTTPPGFQSLPQFGRESFLLTSEEARQLFRLGDSMGLDAKFLSMEVLESVVILQCAGLIGALRVSVERLNVRFRKDPEPPASAVLQYYLSKGVLDSMERCFGSGHSRPLSRDLSEIIIKCLVNDGVHDNVARLSDDEREQLLSLKKSGILVETDGALAFSSPLARKYYWELFYPNRSSDNPSSLDCLIKAIITSMPASVLQQSTVKASGFPKEPTFQHLFMEGLARNTKATCAICPELSDSFPDRDSDSSSRIRGEIDFYLNSDLRWGIELLVSGRGVQEHLDRFCGKYAPLNFKDYVVVDVRFASARGADSVHAHPNRVTVCFQQDFKTCECRFRMDSDVVTLELMS